VAAKRPGGEKQARVEWSPARRPSLDRFAVGETENPIAALPQLLISHVVTASMLIKAMLMTIDLDDQVRSTTFKVHNIR
jgi:hypothetical protein